MTSAIVGLAHVRGVPAATLMVMVVLALVVAQPDILISISAVYGRPDRALGTFELAAIVLSSMLPAVTAPSFDRRERLVFGAPRIAHTTVTMCAFAAPLIILPVWEWRVRLDPLAELPPAIGFAGNLVLFSSIGMTVLLFVGRATSVVVTPALSIGFIVGQQIYPESILTAWFAHPDLGWHTNWGIAALLTLAVATLAWSRGSVPRYH